MEGVDLLRGGAAAAVAKREGVDIERADILSARDPCGGFEPRAMVEDDIKSAKEEELGWSPQQTTLIPGIWATEPGLTCCLACCCCCCSDDVAAVST